MSNAATSALTILDNYAMQLRDALQARGYPNPTVRIEISAATPRSSNSQIYLRCAPYGDDGSDQWETFPFDDDETFYKAFGFACSWAKEVVDPASYELAKLQQKLAAIRETAKRLGLDADVEAAAGRVIAELNVMAALVSRNAITHQPKRGQDPDRGREGEDDWDLSPDDVI